jgi:regulator of PEP synthase PpsR (kinase-PPPase family)
MSPKQNIHIHLISDATGETTHMLARAALGKFAGAQAIEHVWTLVRTMEHLKTIKDEIAEHGGVVFYSISDADIRQELEQICQKSRVPYLSILDPAVRTLSKVLGKPTTARIGAQHRMDEAYFNRMEALEFAVHHDDGQAMSSIHNADILLVGVSRSSKTPTSIYLANRGYKVANYPLVPGIAPPIELMQNKNVLVVGLINEARRLSQIRRNRLESMNVEKDIDYADIRKINDELNQATKLFKEQGWPIIDVSRKSIEETAAEIINIHSQWVEEIS